MPSTATTTTTHKTTGNQVTVFVGNRLEWNGSATTMKKYYYAGSQRVAVRTGVSTLNFILGDHLGSTSLTTSGTGAYQSETLYKPWGEVRYPSGTLPPQYTFTGQYSNVSDFGLMYYGARWYDVSLGRFASADTIIPGAGNPQSWDRFAYSINNPVNYTDPSGHCFVPATGQVFPYAGPGPCPDQKIISGWNPSYGETQGTNECATTALAAGMSVVLGQKISKDDVTSKFRAMGRKFFNIGVPPKVQANGVNALKMGVTATFSQGTSRQDLIDAVLADKIIVITVSWKNPIYYGHSLLVVGYNFKDDALILFNPSSFSSPRQVLENKWPFDDPKESFVQTWLNQPNLGIPSGSMVTLEPSQSSTPPNSQWNGCSVSCSTSVAQ